MKGWLSVGIMTTVLGTQLVWAGEPSLQSFNVPTQMELRGNGATGSSVLPFDDLDQFSDDIPTKELSLLAATAVAEVSGGTRSAKDAQLYRIVSPSVVLIATKEGLGSGSLVDGYGDIITNWHVIRGFEYVAITFKPSLEGVVPTRDDIKLGHVIKYDELSDLALVKATEVPSGRTPIQLADTSDVAVGVDVHAIGHPEGEAWTYTTGVISQYRLGYKWKSSDITHIADVIQTQTPINPGNSGGPLLTDSGGLVGVNSFKDSAAEGLNFAVSVDEVKRFLTRAQSRLVDGPKKPPKEACKPKELSKFRSEANDATVVSFDLFCASKANAEYVIPDDKTKAVFLRADRNNDGKVDVIFFDLKRQGKWDLSFWDAKFEGHWTLVGYHDDGTLTPTRFESYVEFQKRIASK